MVFSMQPQLLFPDKDFSIRIKDTVLNTKDGCDVLRKDVPKEIDEI